ncbi:hypothetical protein [Aureimonas phyllosphaerae]|uniref:Uncharacterized protein n=1 Tax=Aureimonas phyllosphaerae TaxID=1166078 RepID=A0A7W6C4E6_9HYPH|nr:hypothetical protein [Aureimonas phyllosphaerae]MBB3938232.1 hypothetical protein [Aureimonas phyllosphaerae]MBB3962239.1 hypothetical protein [Aureimonas phyllosphaerae]SFF59698.1 hypothetical protein SAMN05216566_1442 [Aureimonas phyllosphaerae]
MTMTDDLNETPTPTHAAANPAARTTAGRQRLTSRNAILSVGALGVLALGFVGGAAAWSATQHREATFDTSLAVTPISDLESSSEVGIAGQVAEIYGNKFVVSDGAAKALVETGRAGEGVKLVTAGETVTVQGRFRDGFLHASAIQHADQHIDELDPPPPPHHGPKHGPRYLGPAGPDAPDEAN